jgi:glycosyltransferase involved in cell wall biosynthesis
MPLRIGIEAHVVNSRPSGNGRVVANLVRALHAGTHHQLFVYFTDPAVAASWRALGWPRLTVRLIRPGNPAFRIPLAQPILAARDRLDVFLAHDNSPPVAPCPVVTLVHDVAFARFPEYFSAFERWQMPRTIPASMRHSRGVITVSNFTKDEIVALYGIAPEKISVAHNGVDARFLDPTPRPSAVDPPFFLTTGNLQPRKNLPTLMRAFRALLQHDPAVRERLVVVGQEAYAADALLAEARDLQASDRVVFAGYLPDQELVGLLQHATAFAYPSVYEGFGLPPVEAMAAGAPTVVSDIPVMREVVGDAALRVPATDVNGWERALRTLATNDAERTRLAEAGRARAGGYTWEAAAAVVAEALERAARSGRRR